eukprot:TRINITY_DN31159_c0_g1_i1.p1 TRINITY_DN31159_c0_g1~~TRINITY_DN31159_c0_g1_i1.p1  ORF type:complete len:381 (+),score=102.60 TRINITY_DN31159_c0_g1_i1:118-1260(+)
MSGFERSAPIPGSQGPRRSQMQRINNAPPPMTPWRKEVLEAQRQAAEAMRKANGGRSRSRSRSRSRPRKKDDGAAAAAGGSGGGATSSGGGSRSSRASKLPDEAAGTGHKDLVLRQAKERGEGWYAAVAQASKVWEEEEKRLSAIRKAAPAPQQSHAREKEKGGKEKDRDRDRDRRRDRDSKDEELLLKKEQEERQREERQRELREKAEQERAWRENCEARERRLEEERRKAEADRKKKEMMEKQRKSKLCGAFAVDGDEDEEPRREATLLLRKADRRRGDLAAPEAIGRPQGLDDGSAGGQASSGAQVALHGSSGAPVPGQDLGKKLGFDDCSDPAEAFMRLQERKRKGRRAEFGGPPRGCSPWRDGKKGVTSSRDRVV